MWTFFCATWAPFALSLQVTLPPVSVARQAFFRVNFAPLRQLHLRNAKFACQQQLTLFPTLLTDNPGLPTTWALGQSGQHRPFLDLATLPAAATDTPPPPHTHSHTVDNSTPFVTRRPSTNTCGFTTHLSSLHPHFQPNQATTPTPPPLLGRRCQSDTVSTPPPPPPPRPPPCTSATA